MNDAKQRDHFYDDGKHSENCWCHFAAPAPPRETVPCQNYDPSSLIEINSPCMRCGLSRESHAARSLAGEAAQPSTLREYLVELDTLVHDIAHDKKEFKKSDFYRWIHTVRHKFALAVSTPPAQPHVCAQCKDEPVLASGDVCARCAFELRRRLTPLAQKNIGGSTDVADRGVKVGEGETGDSPSLVISVLGKDEPPIQLNDLLNHLLDCCGGCPYCGELGYTIGHWHETRLTPPVASARCEHERVRWACVTCGQPVTESDFPRPAALSPAQAVPPANGSKVMENIWERWRDEGLGIEFPPTSHEDAFSIAAHQIDCAIAHALRTSPPQGDWKINYSICRFCHTEIRQVADKTWTHLDGRYEERFHGHTALPKPRNEATEPSAQAVAGEPPVSAIQAEYNETMKRHKEVCADDLYSLLRWDCRDIFNLLFEQQISCAKAAEAIIERKLGYEPRLPERKEEEPAAAPEPVAEPSADVLIGNAILELKRVGWGGSTGVNRDRAVEGLLTADSQFEGLRKELIQAQEIIRTLGGER